MTDLFTASAEKNARPPLAERMRPRTLDEFVGQEHILGPGRLLRRAIQADRLSSVIFAGPPGTGKTTLARIVANTTQSQFLAINAVLAGVKDIREAIESAGEARKLHGRGTLLFVDEVHRFNKAQQDALLPHVESGALILIGATTENPFFEVNKALVSRSRIFQLRSLEDKDVRRALENALADAERGYGKLRVESDPGAMEHLVRMAGGDARSALNALELAVETTSPGPDGAIWLTLSVAEESIQRKAVLYDKDGDAHYDTISAFIKSVRGSDPDAALYWLAKMVEAGEDPRFILRRMAILAAEDVGLADPQALAVVMSAAQAFDFIGLPEGQFHLAEACLYLSTAPKSNSVMAYFDALETVRREKAGEVPDPLKDKSRDGDELGHGKGYLYPHAFRDHWVAQQYLPAGLRGRVFYEPSEVGHEAALRIEVMRRREAQLAALSIPHSLHSPEINLRAMRGGGGVKVSGDDWLNRASGTGSDALRALRDDLCELAGLRRESLVLDLGGHRGFLTWEALRRCVEGGVWTRCGTPEEEKEISGWAERAGALGKPKSFVAAWPQLPEVLQGLAEKPVFDMVLGLQVPRFSEAWMDSLRAFAPRARIVLALRKEADTVPLDEWLSGAPASLREKANSFPLIAVAPADPAFPKNWRVEKRGKLYPDRRRLTPSQANEFLDKISATGKILAAVRSGLGPVEWENLSAAAGAYLTGGLRDFRVGYEIWIAGPG